MRILLVTFALLQWTYSASAQHRVLALEMPNQNKNAYYRVGDELTFYLPNKRSRRTERILALEDSLIVFRGYSVPVNQIVALHIDDQTRWWLRYKPSQLAIMVGAGYLVVDTINNRELNEETLVISGSLIGLGLLFRLLIPNKIKIKGKRKLSILMV